MSIPKCAAVLMAALLSSGCAFHSTAMEWNGRVGPDGVPVYYKSMTKVGLNLLVLIPVLGRLGIDGMVNDMTEEVRAKGGDRVRVVQGSTENYWYGFSPFTWIITPVVSTLAVEYRPYEEVLKQQEADARAAAEKEGEAVLVTGSIVYREKVALPPEATVEIELLDVTEADAPSVISWTTLHDPANIPVPFELRGVPKKIEPEHSYVVQATILSGGRVLFTTASPQPVLTKGHPAKIELMTVQRK